MPALPEQQDLQGSEVLDLPALRVQMECPDLPEQSEIRVQQELQGLVVLALPVLQDRLAQSALRDQQVWQVLRELRVVLGPLVLQGQQERQVQSDQQV